MGCGGSGVLFSGCGYVWSVCVLCAVWGRLVGFVICVHLVCLWVYVLLGLGCLWWCGLLRDRVWVGV